MSTPYQQPEWCQNPPPSTWSLDEIKNGSIINTYRLDQSCVTFGRAEDQVSIVTAHPSCSRLHARIAFDMNTLSNSFSSSSSSSSSLILGTPWLRDLGSAHGTFVNKRPLPKKSVGKMENGKGEGSRGVILFPGDIVQFGASTRFFCLVGPTEKEKQFFKPPDTNNRNSKQMNNEKTKLESETKQDGISWGIDTDDSEASDDADLSSTSTKSLDSLDYNNVPSKQQPKLQRLNAKKHKLANLQLESERISRKGFDTLSTGQLAQLEKNATREAALKQEIQDLEQSIRQAISGANESRNKRKHHKHDDDEEEYNYEDDDVDDFYDRTKDQTKRRRTSKEKYNNDINTNEEALSEQELRKQWLHFLKQLEINNIDKSRCKARVEDLEKTLIQKKQQNDDTFFISNDIQLAKEALQKVQEVEDTTMKELETVEIMLKVCTNNPNLLFNRQEQNIQNIEKKDKGASNKSKINSHEISTLPASTSDTNKALNSEMNESSIMMPPPSRTSVSSNQFKKGEINTTAIMPPPPPLQDMVSSRIINPDMPPPKKVQSPSNNHRSQPIQTTSFDSQTENKKSLMDERIQSHYKPVEIDNRSIMPPPPPVKVIKKAENPKIKTKRTNNLALGSFISSNKKSTFSSQAVTQNQYSVKNSTNKNYENLQQQGKVDMWRAPEGQDGSGKTKLNAKFAGRY